MAVRTRRWNEVKCKVVGDSDWSPFVRRTLQSHFQLANPAEPAEIEVVCQAQWTIQRTAACRVVVAPQYQNGFPSSLSRRAHLDPAHRCRVGMRYPTVSFGHKQRTVTLRCSLESLR